MVDKKRPSLGRGLDKLLSTPASAVVSETAPLSERLVNLPIDVIQRGKYQPRRDMNVRALEELANSIRSQGILQPVVVRQISPERYELIAGERRWRAAQLIELDVIPAIIKEVSDEDTMAMALIENIQRENLNPMEEANAIRRLIDEFSMTHQQVADAIGKSRTTVTNLLRLIGLATEVKELVERGDIEFGHAKVLLGLEGQSQVQAARIIVAKELSVRETEQLVRRMASPAKQLYPTKSIDPDLRQLQNKLADRLGASVNIAHSAKGKGKLVIHYNNLDELDGILEHIIK